MIPVLLLVIISITALRLLMGVNLSLSLSIIFIVSGFAPICISTINGSSGMPIRCDKSSMSICTAWLSSVVIKKPRYIKASLISLIFFGFVVLEILLLSNQTHVEQIGQTNLSLYPLVQMTLCRLAQSCQWMPG